MKQTIKFEIKLDENHLPINIEMDAKIIKLMRLESL